VFGSLAGEYAGARGWLGEGLWFWFGHQGWGYLDLGRLWQILLIVGLFEWARLPGDALFIVGGSLPLVWLCSQALRYPNPRRIEAEVDLPQTLYTYESEPGK
jgi:hypothetical protein